MPLNPYDFGVSLLRNDPSRYIAFGEAPYMSTYGALIYAVRRSSGVFEALGEQRTVLAQAMLFNNYVDAGFSTGLSEDHVSFVAQNAATVRSRGRSLATMNNFPALALVLGMVEASL